MNTAQDSQPAPARPDPLATLDEGAPFQTPRLRRWMDLAESGERFDLIGEDARRSGELTRVRFDGAKLRAEHRAGGELICALELRWLPSGAWRAFADTSLLGAHESRARAASHACEDIEKALADMEPREPLGWSKRLLWAAPWSRKPLGAR